MTILPFTNPWPFSQKEKEADVKVCKCINTYIPLDVYTDIFHKIRFIRDTNAGTVSTTVNLLIKKLHDELQRRGITDFSKCVEFEQFIANCRLCLPSELAGSTAGGVDSKAATPDDGGRTEGSGSQPAPNPVLDSNAQGRSVIKEKRKSVSRKRKSIGVEGKL